MWASSLLEAIGNTGAQALYGQEAVPCHGVDLLKRDDRGLSSRNGFYKPRHFFCKPLVPFCGLEHGTLAVFIGLRFYVLFDV